MSRPGRERRVVMSVRRLRRAGPAALLAAALLAGCGGGNDATPTATPQVPVTPPGGTPVTPGGGGVVVGAPQANSAVCDGVDLAAFTSRVYVSEAGSDGAGCGQRTDQTCRTIQQGLSTCAANGAGCGVVVRHGLYPAAQTLRLADGVAIQAGCRFDGEADRHYRSVMQMAAGVTQGINATGIKNNLTVVRGLVVVGGDSPASTANIGLVAEASPGLSVQQSLIVAGRGGDGVDPNAPDGSAGETGIASNNQQNSSGAGGGRACPSNTPAPFAYGHGGQGGDGMGGNASPCDGYACSCRINNQSSIGGKDGTGTAKGPTAGGSGGDNGAKPSEACVFPAYGQDFYGRGGQGGAGGRCAATGGTRASDVWGAFSAGVWSPSSGTAGAPGDTGAGGGGGSSGGFCIQLGSGGLNVDHFVYGVPGGGGGGGGCGGGDGRGGVQGGVSIALLVKNMPADRLMDGNGWVAGVGGRGGRGGTGGAGGAGGRGGARGGGLFSTISNVYGMAVACPAPSGAGGDGGQGGAGSGGGAGNGGPSIGVALTGSAALPAAQDGIYVGAPGLGGAAGAGGAGSNCTGGGGDAGIGGAAGAVVNVDGLPQNVLAAGDVLESGQSRTSPNGSHSLTMQADGNLCFHRNGSFAWCSQQSYQASGVRLTMGTDGNLCLRDSSGGATWCTNSTVGHTGAYLALRDDGSVAVFDGSVSLVTLP